MSIERSPTYDKAHYSWQAPSSQASQSIIEDSSQQANKDQSNGDKQGPESHPGLPKRSTSNYKQASEEHRKKILEDGQQATGEIPDAEPDTTGGRRGSITSKPFKPSAKRTKSWDIRDLRGQLQMSAMRDGDADGPTDGFTEV